MQKEKIAKKILTILDELYPSPPIPLLHRDLYTLLIAVVLSAQCTDERVNRISPKLFEKADNPTDMIKLDPLEIEEIIRPCGLSKRKSQAIWTLSQELLLKYEGKVPNSFEALEALPGVGHKTASVIMAQGFYQPAFPVDTHIHRCAYRWQLSSGKNVIQTEKDLKRLFPKKTWIRLHLQIIYFAREYCPARNHDPLLCPICSWIIQAAAS